MSAAVRPRWAGAWRRAVGYVRRHPFSAGLSVLLIATGVATGAVWGQQPAALAVSPTAIGPGRMWWTPVSALLVPDTLFELVLSLVMALTLLAYAERLLGSVRCALVFFATGALGMLAGAGVQALADAWGQVWAQAEAGDLVLDPPTGIAGAVMACSALAPVLFRRRIRLLGFSVLLMLTVYAGDIDALYRLIAAAVGLMAGLLLARGRPQPAWHRSSYGETRTLVAALVAVTSLGPLIVLVTGVGAGPMAPVVAGLRGVDVDAILDRCTTAPTDRCVADLSAALAGGIGAFAMALMPLVLALIAAWGLWRGRRAAWVLALAENVTMLVLTAISLGASQLHDPGELAELDRSFPGFAFAALAIPLSMCAVLLGTRRCFVVRAERRAVVRTTVIVGVAFVVVLAVEVGLILVLTRHGGVGTVIAESFRHLLPAGIGRVHASTALHGIPRQVHRDAGAVFWAVFAVAMAGLFRAPAALPDGDPGRFRRLLKTIGGGTMGFMGTWEGTRHWFAPDGSGAVAYRVASGIALTVSDPVCAPDRRESTVRGFIDFCDSRAWTPVFYSVHDELLPALHGLGWRSVHVGEETIVPLSRFELTGKVWTKVRQPYNRGIRDGLTAVWTRWQDLGVGMTAQLQALSEQWVAEKALPEMRFTLGGLAELKDPDVALMLAIGPEGELQGVTSWLPCWQDGVITGWTLDFMRRSDDGMPGVMEFLIASAALRMKGEGLAFLSLSGAPLARSAGLGPDADALVRLLAWLGRVLEPAYGFASLMRFKQKFNPEHRVLWMAYADAAQLPAIGLALSRAYLPDLAPWEYVALARTLSG